MNFPQPQEKSIRYKIIIREAIDLANQGRWLEAIKVNQSILEMFPNDIDALNRLGKGFSEVGQYSQAKMAFGKSLILSPSNNIAKKNLERLNHLEDGPPPKGSAKPTPHIFIQEGGKSCVTILRNIVPKETIALVSPGETLSFLVDGASVYLLTSQNIVLGQLEPKLASLMIKLLDTGNKYLIAVATLANGQLSVIIRETYRHPNMRYSVSFPISTNGVQNHFQFSEGDFLGGSIHNTIPGEFGVSDEIEPEIDPAIEESGINRAVTSKSIIDTIDDDRDDE